MTLCCYYERGDETKTLCTIDPTCPELHNNWQLVGSWSVADCDDCCPSADHTPDKPPDPVDPSVVTAFSIAYNFATEGQEYSIISEFHPLAENHQPVSESVAFFHATLQKLGWLNSEQTAALLAASKVALETAVKAEWIDYLDAFQSFHDIVAAAEQLTGQQAALLTGILDNVICQKVCPPQPRRPRSGYKYTLIGWFPGRVKGTIICIYRCRKQTVPV